MRVDKSSVALLPTLNKDELKTHYNETETFTSERLTPETHQTSDVTLAACNTQEIHFTTTKLITRSILLQNYI